MTFLADCHFSLKDLSFQSNTFQADEYFIFRLLAVNFNRISKNMSHKLTSLTQTIFVMKH